MRSLNSKIRGIPSVQNVTMYIYTRETVEYFHVMLCQANMFHQIALITIPCRVGYSTNQQIVVYCMYWKSQLSSNIKSNSVTQRKKWYNTVNNRYVMFRSTESYSFSLKTVLSTATRRDSDSFCVLSLYQCNNGTVRLKFTMGHQWTTILHMYKNKCYVVRIR